MNIIAACARPLTRLMAIASRGYTAPKPSPVTYGPAMIATPWQKPDGLQRPNLTLRAHRLHNRSPKAAAVYLRVHTILDRGR
jgi:hypothetical protein